MLQGWAVPVTTLPVIHGWVMVYGGTPYFMRIVPVTSQLLVHVTVLGTDHSLPNVSTVCPSIYAVNGQSEN